MSVPALHPIADSLPEIRVSTGSIWSDHVWQLDVTLPGTVRSDVALDWVFTLPDGSRFTDAQWTTWRDAAKRAFCTSSICNAIGCRMRRERIS
jgi:hypothetical protein